MTKSKTVAVAVDEYGTTFVYVSLSAAHERFRREYPHFNRTAFGYRYFDTAEKTQVAIELTEKPLLSGETYA